MSLRNSTEWPDWFLKRLVSWCCKQSGLPVRQVVRADFRNRASSYSGHAYSSMRIVVSIGWCGFPTEADNREGMAGESFADRVEALVAVTAHEIEHLCQYREGRGRALKRRRKSEPATRAHEVRCLRLFRANRERLLAEWSVPPRRRAAVKLTRRERNEANARKLLATWERKAKLAKTKIANYRRKVRYYDRVAASKPPSAPPPEIPKMVRAALSHRR